MLGAVGIGTAVSERIGVSRTDKLRNGEYGQGSLGQIRIGLFRPGNVWYGLAVEARRVSDPHAMEQNGLSVVDSFGGDLVRIPVEWTGSHGKFRHGAGLSAFGMAGRDF